MNDAKIEAPGMKRSLQVLLFASLALNLLVVGLVLGAAFSHRADDDHRHRSHVSQPGGPLAAALERRDRRAVGRELRQAIGAERAAQGSARSSYGNVIAVLTATPYDADAMRAAVTAQMQPAIRRVELGVDILLDRLDGMTPAERAAYAERLQEVLERAPARRRK